MNQFSKIRFLKIFFIVALFFVLPNFSQAAIIFEDNFDAQADWWPTCKQCGKNNAGYNGGADVNGTPLGWTYWRNDELWNPFLSSGSVAGSHPTIQISNEQHYGATGKGYVQWNESNDGASGDGWGADGILSKAFAQSYPEMYVQVKIKFPIGFQWKWTPEQNSGALKVMRFYHYDGESAGSPFSFFSDGTSAPIYVFGVSTKETPYNTRDTHTVRCDPQLSNYYCNQSYDMASSSFGQGVAVSGDLFSTVIGDGNWHTLTWRTKLNSAPGAADGILQMWYDETLRFSQNSIDWIGTGGDVANSWNIIGVGGNAFNQHSDPINNAEQWYAIDDVVVSTTSIPTDYVIGNSDNIAPAAPSGLGVM